MRAAASRTSGPLFDCRRGPGLCAPGRLALDDSFEIVTHGERSIRIHASPRFNSNTGGLGRASGASAGLHPRSSTIQQVAFDAGVRPCRRESGRQVELVLCRCTISSRSARSRIAPGRRHHACAHLPPGPVRDPQQRAGRSRPRGSATAMRHLPNRLERPLDPDRRQVSVPPGSSRRSHDKADLV